MLFVREDAVEAAWAIVDPILANATRLHHYEPGSWGPREPDRLAIDVGGWHDPEERKESTPCSELRVEQHSRLPNRRQRWLPRAADHYAGRFRVL